MDRDPEIAERCKRGKARAVAASRRQEQFVEVGHRAVVEEGCICPHAVRRVRLVAEGHRQHHAHTTPKGLIAENFCVHQVHPRRADETADESMFGGFKQPFGCAHLHHAPLVQYDELIGKGQYLGLVMSDVDHGMA